jgi:hypothetical protein
LHHGNGVLTLPSGQKYEGDFFNGESNGKGVWIWPEGQR